MFKRLLHGSAPVYSLKPIDGVFILLAVAVLAALTIPAMSMSSIWFDESFSAYIIQFNFVDIAKFTGLDVHPPLYYWFLKIWSTIFGTTEVALRSMSLFFAAIAIGFGYLLTLRYFGRRTALITLGILVLSPMVLRYSQEMRMYTMVTAICLAATYVLLRATESKKRSWWIGYGVLLAAGMLTHYFAAVVWIAHWVWRAFDVSLLPRPTKKKANEFFSKNWISAHVLSLVLFGVWLPVMFHQLAIVQSAGFWIPDINPVTLINYYTNSILYLDARFVTPWLTVSMGVLVVLLVWCGRRVYKQASAVQKRTLGLVIALTFVPTLLLVVMSLPPLESSFVDRYLIPSSFSLALLIGIVIGQAPKVTKGRAAPVALAVLAPAMLLYGVIQLQEYGNYNKIERQGYTADLAFAAVENRATDGEPILAQSSWTYYDIVFYATPEHPVYFRNEARYSYGALQMLAQDDRNKIFDMDAFIQEHPTIWYIGRPGNNQLDSPHPALDIVERIPIVDIHTDRVSHEVLKLQRR